MAHTNAFSDYLVDLLTNGTAGIFDNANAYIGIGDDATAFAAGQTQLQAEAVPGNSVRVGMDAGFPVIDPDNNGSNNIARYQITLGTSSGNFVWNEWGIFNDPIAGTMMTRVAEFLGEKSNKATWVFEVDITIA